MDTKLRLVVKNDNPLKSDESNKLTREKIIEYDKRNRELHEIFLSMGNLFEELESNDNYIEELEYRLYQIKINLEMICENRGIDFLPYNKLLDLADLQEEWIEYLEIMINNYRNCDNILEFLSNIISILEPYYYYI